MLDRYTTGPRNHLNVAVIVASSHSLCQVWQRNTVSEWMLTLSYVIVGVVVWRLGGVDNET